MKKRKKRENKKRRGYLIKTYKKETHTHTHTHKSANRQSITPPTPSIHPSIYNFMFPQFHIPIHPPISNVCNRHNSYHSFCSALLCSALLSTSSNLEIHSPIFKQPKLHLIVVNSNPNQSKSALFS